MSPRGERCNGFPEQGIGICGEIFRQSSYRVAHILMNEGTSHRDPEGYSPIKAVVFERLIFEDLCERLPVTQSTMKSQTRSPVDWRMCLPS